MILLSIILILSLVINGILLWYSRKLVSQFKSAVKNLDAFQGLLDDYLMSLEAVGQLDEYYGDDTIKLVIQHTTMVAESCRGFKSTMIDNGEEPKDAKKNLQSKEGELKQ